MIETEITQIPPVSPAEVAVMNGHALLNLYRVVRDELALLGRELAGDPELFSASLAACDVRATRLGDASSALDDAATTHAFKDAVQNEVESRLLAARGRLLTSAVVASRDRLDSLLWILQVRAHELVTRATAPQPWAPFNADELLADFHELLHAMEQHGRGRYRFVYNLAQQEPTDYYIDLRFDSARGNLVMPPVLKDVLRDLVANARKFTAPGGQIRAALHSSSEGVRLVVEDTGCGIPADELRTVVHYGRRARNASGIRSFGAGCGLTKAFVATRQLGGNFWIASELGRGTRVRLWIPRRAS